MGALGGKEEGTVNAGWECEEIAARVGWMGFREDGRIWMCAKGIRKWPKGEEWMPDGSAERLGQKAIENRETTEERQIDAKVPGMGIDTGEDCELVPDMIKVSAKNP